MDQKFSEFSEFRDSDKSLKHEMGLNLQIISVSYWHCDSILSLTQKVTGSTNPLKNVIFFVAEFSEFSEKI